MTALRRMVTFPLTILLMSLVLAAGPLLLIVGGLGSLAARSTRPVRTAALLIAYASIELRMLGRFLLGERDCDELMRDFLVKAYAAVRKILDVEVVLDAGSLSPDAIPRAEPLIVLSRHCGPGDSVLVAWLLAIEYRLQVRIVLKAVLRCEPALDLAGGLGGLCFLGRGDRARRQIRDFAASLGGGQALLLFPEGANFTWPRWREAIRALRSTGGIRAANRALRQSHTLPPRSGGAAAAVSGAPSANVLVLTHNGFCADGRARPWWQMPIHRQLLIRTSLVPAAQIPPPDQLAPWLDQTWSQVDAWVAAHTDEA
ncbi:MAG TPA: 1-acyl-sn-glycerol-3-phosphate acyltransferase [Mycobacterium sp.]|nr:1-acyl-sn-glycerol-3-phosphate acyltransferase [Mycobacterium sp.]